MLRINVALAMSVVVGGIWWDSRGNGAVVAGPVRAAWTSNSGSIQGPRNGIQWDRNGVRLTGEISGTITRNGGSITGPLGSSIQWDTRGGIAVVPVAVPVATVAFVTTQQASLAPLPPTVAPLPPTVVR